MKTRAYLLKYTCAAVAFLAVTSSADTVLGQQPGKKEAAVAAPSSAPLVVSEDASTKKEALSSVQQGQTPMSDTFGLDARLWRLEKRRDALRDTEFKFNLRNYYFDQDKLDNSQSQALAIGGWAGVKTGYFLDHISFGATLYGSQPLYGPEDKDGTRLLKTGQEGYMVLGEAYADIRIMKDLHFYIGRKEFDTPYLNPHDNRMTPNTFEAIMLQGKAEIGENGATLKYGLGYFDRIKNRDADMFISMATDAGASVERGVFAAGALYQNGDFSIGGIDYYSQDIINIAYAEAKLAVPITNKLKPTFAIQFTDQRSVGSDLLKDGDSFSIQQFGIKTDLPVGNALFTAAYTQNTNGSSSIQEPWGGYVGYTSSLMEDFLRAGEGAFLLQAGYDIPWVEGLRASVAYVHGTTPNEAGQFGRDECDFDVQWSPKKEGFLKGLALRVRYAIVDQRGGAISNASELRVICNYTYTF